MELWRKTEWNTAPMATRRKQSIDWVVVAVYSAILAVFVMCGWLLKCGHGMTLFGGWVFLGGVWLVWDANDRRFWRSFATFVVGIAAIIAGSVMMGAGS